MDMMEDNEDKAIFKKVPARRVFQDIADQVRELIYAGVLKPEDRLPPERELAKQFGAGRTAVREALRVLEQAGFIYIKQGMEGGAFVRNADMKVVTESFSNLIKLGNISIAQLMEARIALEGLVLEFAMGNMDEYDLELLEKNILDTEDVLKNRIHLRRENLNFHVLIARTTKNPIFEMIIQAVLDIMFGYLSKFHPDQQYLENNLNAHRAIYAALKTKDLERARLSLREHLNIVGTKLEELSRATMHEAVDTELVNETSGLL